MTLSRRGRRFSEAEIERIDAAVVAAIDAGVSSYALAKKLGVSAGLLIKRAGLQKLKFRSSRFWSRAELAELRKLAKTHTCGEIAELLGREQQQVRQQCYYRRSPPRPARDCG